MRIEVEEAIVFLLGQMAVLKAENMISKKALDLLLEDRYPEQFETLRSEFSILSESLIQQHLQQFFDILSLNSVEFQERLKDLLS